MGCQDNGSNDKHIKFEEVKKQEIEFLKSLGMDNSGELVGLAFSGGGIRSATVNLGVLQALADKNLLRHFDYLSTVSGGGYIGAWFTALLNRHGGLINVQKDLLRHEAKSSANKAGRPIGFLRTYSNYLTPKLGLSLDTLASFCVWLTNTLLNQLVIFSLFVAILTFTIGINHLVNGIEYAWLDCMGVILFGISTIAGGYASVKKWEKSDSYLWIWIFIAGVIGVVMFVISGVIPKLIGITEANWEANYKLFELFSAKSEYRLGLGVPLVMLFISTIMILILGVLGRGLLKPEETNKLDGLRQLDKIKKIFYSIGSTGFREWWSRFGGVSIYVGVLWLLLFIVAIYLPAIIQESVSETWFSFSAITSYISAWGVAKLGQSAHTGGTNSIKLLEKLAKFLPYLVISLIFIGISYLTYWLIEVHGLSALYLFLIAMAIVGLGSCRFDINVFSLHNFYRNRLTRCYLGATIENRYPNPFTGFNSKDDLEFSKCKQRPLHIINTALNITAGKELAWQQRKAASFSFTPLYSGFELPDRHKTGAYRCTEEFNNKHLMLGSLIAVSGAAASPNGGYHTNPAMAFLMTMFNARLGRWFGNPITKNEWKNQSPKYSILYLIWELFARTREDSEYVYLSDGGHFENLGIYELLRRNCRLIFAIDAGQDKEFSFEDLGNMIRKSRTDLDVQIDMNISDVEASPETGLSKEHFVLGCVNYPDGTRGLLVYIKNSLTGDETADIKSYKHQSPDFPHHSTGDQFFDETQFESYRQLGYHMTQEVTANLPAKLSKLNCSGQIPDLKSVCNFMQQCEQ